MAAARLLVQKGKNGRSLKAKDGDAGFSVQPPPRHEELLHEVTASNARFVLADFGNACWEENQYTADIQMRQYRSPEVILSLPYDCSTDLWSAACMFFECATGDFLFEPQKITEDSENEEEEPPWGSDDDHLRQMIGALGSYPPVEWVCGRPDDPTRRQDWETKLSTTAKTCQNMNKWSKHFEIVCPERDRYRPCSPTSSGAGGSPSQQRTSQGRARRGSSIGGGAKTSRKDVRGVHVSNYKPEEYEKEKENTEHHFDRVGLPRWHGDIRGKLNNAGGRHRRGKPSKELNPRLERQFGTDGLPTIARLPLQTKRERVGRRKAKGRISKSRAADSAAENADGESEIDDDAPGSPTAAEENLAHVMPKPGEPRLPPWSRNWKPEPLPGYANSYGYVNSRGKGGSYGAGPLKRQRVDPGDKPRHTEVPNSVYTGEIGNTYLEFRFRKSKLKACYRRDNDPTVGRSIAADLDEIDGEDWDGLHWPIHHRSIYHKLINLYQWAPCEAGYFSDFLMQMLRWRPEDRMTPAECLTHPWLWQPAIARNLSTHPERNQNFNDNVRAHPLWLHPHRTSVVDKHSQERPFRFQAGPKTLAVQVEAAMSVPGKEPEADAIAKQIHTMHPFTEERKAEAKRLRLTGFGLGASERPWKLNLLETREAHKEGSQISLVVREKEYRYGFFVAIGGILDR